jgi:hypothetical protein
LFDTSQRVKMDLILQTPNATSDLTDHEDGEKAAMPNTVAAIRDALETAGVEFIEENAGGAGVRLRASEA